MKYDGCDKNLRKKSKYQLLNYEEVYAIDDHAKDGGLGEVWILRSFCHEPLHTWIKTNLNKFAISSTGLWAIEVLKYNFSEHLVAKPGLI